MTSLSVNLPWQSYLAPHLPVLRAGIARDLPGFDVRFETGETELVAVLDAEGGAAAVFAVAEYLAPMWPALLGDYGVALSVTVAGSTWTADAALMGEVAGGGVAATGWLAGAVFDVR